MKALQAEIEEQRKAKEAAEAKQAAESPNPPAPKPVVAAANVPSVDTPKSPQAAQPVTNLRAPEERTQAVAKNSIRSSDVAGWKRNDYYDAKQSGDPQLIAAVAYLGEHFSGKESSAELLTRLIETPTDDPFASDASGNAAAQRRKLVEAIVAALDANGTSKARQTLERLVTGELHTSDPQAAAAAAWKAIMLRRLPESEELLCRSIVPSPSLEMVVPTVDPDTLRRDVLGMIQSSASESFRTRLANILLASDAPQPAYTQLLACLLEPRSENITAQMVLYQADRTDPATQRLLEDRFLAKSAAAGWQWMNIPKTAATSPILQKAAEAADLPSGIGSLWGQTFAAVLQKRLGVVQNFQEGHNLLSLASTIPAAQVREAMRQAFLLHWEEDPTPIHPLASIAEPGLLVVLKSLPRRDVVPARNDKSKTSSTAKPSPKVAAVLKARQQEEASAERWIAFSEKVAQAFRERFRVAATVGENADNLPLKLHPGAQIRMAYAFDASAQHTAKSDNPSSMLRVRFVRIEQRGRPTKLLAFYRRQLRDYNERTIGNEEIWLDGFANSSDGVCSADVFLTKPSQSFHGAAEQEQRVVVEILTVECDRVTSRMSEKE